MDLMPMPHKSSNLRMVPDANAVGHRVPIRLRRQLFAGLVAATVLTALALMVWTLSAGGYDAVDMAMTLLFATTIPWAAIGFWNAVIGLSIMRTACDAGSAVCPPLADATDRSPITTRTALLSCIRNEDPQTVGRNLDLMIDGLTGAGVAEHFQVFVLSDSDWPEVIAAEEARVAELSDRWHGRMRITYRRREENLGFKAGNIRDFCEQWGAGFDFMLVLDADSLMAPDTMLRMVRSLQTTPHLGILQTLMVGLPSASAFARPFQFGMRLGMRSYSIGSAWWQADAGPYWGHNALIRMRPFVDHCALPHLPGRGPLAGAVLSHDQIEAALMRRAGYEVRVMPTEDGSWEENPTTLPEFLRRDLRWCQGNLQYLKLMHLPDLHPVSRVQLLLAILMFVSSPAWVGLMVLGALRMAYDTGPIYEPLPGQILFFMIMGMIFAPKLASLTDALATTSGRQRYGGAPRLLIGSLAEVAFSMLIAPIMAVAHSVFIGGLFFGRAVVWDVQRRVPHWVSPMMALRRLWPQTLIGTAALVWFAVYSPNGALLFSPFFIGALLAVPIAVTTSLPALGLLLARLGLWRIPDEVAPHRLVQALHLPVLALRPAKPLIGDAATEHPE
ncbi:MAG: glucans biosynthesis glucosyltransferase MdoH [Thiohalocapsa sp.]